MQEHSLEALEYNKILEILETYCYNVEAKNKALSLKPLTNIDLIEKLLEEVNEAVSMTLVNGRIPITTIEDITPLLSRARIDSTLSMGELLNISSLLKLSQDLKQYYRAVPTENINLEIISELFGALSSITELEKDITQKIISPTEMADNASRKLSELRKEKFKKNQRITSTLEGIINNSNNEKYLQEKIVSLRNGRYVIPVKNEYRSKFPGAVIDRSSTGSTVFIEPLSVLELNNDINELEVEERKEINRILRDLTEKVKFYSLELDLNYNSIINLDFIFAKANYALDINGNKANISDNEIHLKKARHPLIDKEKVVASNFYIEPSTRTLVITGPNTGGKTVSLKTLGLLAAMNQSGLFIPVNDGSKLKIFNSIFADIGDEQSIEQSLSTFSSHLTNIVSILNNKLENSLILFDELGAGTDPVEGAALAVSILEHLRNTSNLTVATTHYAEIKEYALNVENVENASVEFDVNSLKPTYKLIMGLPGKSNAFEIAMRLGIPEEIITNSKNRINEDTLKFDKTLEKVQEELFKARQERDEAVNIRKKAESEYKRLLKDKEKFLILKDRIISDAKKKAKDIVNETKKETDDIYRELQRLQQQSGKSVDNKKLESLRRQVKSSEEKFIDEHEENPITDKIFKIEDFKKGDRVFIKSLDQEADIVSVNQKKKKIEIASGVIRMTVKPEDLLLLNPKKESKQVNIQTSNRIAKMETRLDLRGKTSEEALRLLDDFINEALLLDQRHLEIIHGFGTGQIRKTVHNYLRKSKHVSSFRLGGPGEGGAGATIIEL